MKLVVGLGNVGGKYAETRHNVGFMVVDAIVKKLSVSPHVENKFNSLVFYHHESQSIFARPQTFMNDSGVAVKKLVDFYKVNMDDLWIVHDDLDIKLGEYKIQRGVGPKLHYGIASIEEKLGNKEFWRVRLGVDNREPENRMSGEQYVLQDFSDSEREVIMKIIDKVADELVEKVASSK